jgi:hypothetical protein
MTRKLRWLPWLLVLACAVSASPAAASGIAGAKVEGNALSAKIRLPGGVGADLSVGFEQVVGLSAANLGLSARLLDAADLALVAGRLPSALTSVPTGFPVLLTIEPPESSGLSFSGLVSIELYTHALTYLPGCPFRLFAAPLGGAFSDITESNAGGSYRVRGHKGDFSEFLIVADARAVDAAITVKFAQAQNELAAHAAAIAPAVLATLVALLDEAEDAYAAGQTVQAIAKVEAFAATVKQHSGSGIPDVWRSARDLANAAGELRAAASTLRFSLLLKANGAS